jgi:hypothetical protein
VVLPSKSFFSHGHMTCLYNTSKFLFLEAATQKSAMWYAYLTNQKFLFWKVTWLAYITHHCSFWPHHPHPRYTLIWYDCRH